MKSVIVVVEFEFNFRLDVFWRKEGLVGYILIKKLKLRCIFIIIIGVYFCKCGINVMDCF